MEAPEGIKRGVSWSAYVVFTLVVVGTLLLWGREFTREMVFVKPHAPFLSLPPVSWANLFTFGTFLHYGWMVLVLAVIASGIAAYGRKAVRELFRGVAMMSLLYLSISWFNTRFLDASKDYPRSDEYFCAATQWIAPWGGGWGLGCMMPVAVPMATFNALGWMFPLVGVLWFLKRRLGGMIDGQSEGDTRPAPSGVHGTAEIATPAMLAEAGLTGNKWGEGFRLCEDDEGNIIRYRGKKTGKPQPNSIAIIGPPRCGKLATLAAALTVENQGSMFINDPRGELFAITQRARKTLGPVKVIAPFMDELLPEIAALVGETDSYNILDELNPASDSFEMACDAIAEILVAADESGESKSAGYFTDNARRAASGVIMELKTNWPDEANLARVCKILSTEEIFAFSRTAIKTGNPYVQSRLSMFAEPKAEEAAGIRDFQKTANAQLGFMSGRAMERVLKTPKTPWRLTDLKDGEEPVTVFVIIPTKFAASAARFNRMLIGALASALIGTRRGNHHVTILADEFPAMGRIPIFNELFSMGGGAGVSLIPIAQNVAQMTRVWGHEGWKTIKSCCDLTLYFPPKEEETVAELVRMGGQRTIVTQSYSYSAKPLFPQSGLAGLETALTGGGHSTNYSEMGKPVLDPHDIPALAGRCFIHAPGISKNLIVGHMRTYWDYPDVAKLCDPNPWHEAAPSPHAKTANG